MNTNDSCSDLAYWELAARRLHWDSPWKETFEQNNADPATTSWFTDGRLNACFNCIDRHLPARRDLPAIIWHSEACIQSDQHTDHAVITFGELHASIVRISNGLLANGLQPGDTVTICLPPSPLAISCMLACARIGITHSSVLFSLDQHELDDRHLASNSRAIVTTASGVGKCQSILSRAAPYRTGCSKVLVLQEEQQAPSFDAKYPPGVSPLAGNDEYCPCLPVDSNSPIFHLYTSGSTGKPKRVTHRLGGFLVYALDTYVSNLRPPQDKLLWATANPTTGHSYTFYAQLLLGEPCLLVQPESSQPLSAYAANIIRRHGIHTLYASPAFLTEMMQSEAANEQRCPSLRVVGSVGERLPGSVRNWCLTQLLNNCGHAIDTWWQTETGGIMMYVKYFAPAKDHHRTLTLAAGIKATICNELQDPAETHEPQPGSVYLLAAWPSQPISIEQSGESLSPYRSIRGRLHYNTGDIGTSGANGTLQLMGRMGDSIRIDNVLYDPAQIEDQLRQCEGAQEVAVIQRGQLCQTELVVVVRPAYATINDNALAKNITDEVSACLHIPSESVRLEVLHDLPRTRSGKLLRRKLRERFA